MLFPESNLTLVELEWCRELAPLQLSVEAHAYELGQISRSIEIADFDVASWLEIAAGLESVSCDLNKHQDTMMCGQAYRYFSSKTESAEMLLLELTRFQFVWSALESHVGTMPNRGPKVPTIMQRLERFSKQFAPLVHSDCARDSLVCMMGRSEEFEDVAAAFFPRPGSASAVFRAVAELRNGMAHGLLPVGEPQGRGGMPRLSAAVFRNASRIVLYTIQMLTVERFADRNYVIEHRWGFEDEYQEMPLIDVVQRLHTVSFQC